MTKRMSPRLEALAFRIWQVSRDVDWMLTVPQLAAVLGEDEIELRRVCRHKDWISRLPDDFGQELAA